jgi:hypothetical protein
MRGGTYGKGSWAASSSDQELFARADAVFTGRLVRRDEPGRPASSGGARTARSTVRSSPAMIVS